MFNAYPGQDVSSPGNEFTRKSRTLVLFTVRLLLFRSKY